MNVQFKGRQVSINTFKKFLELCSALSPENLSCDGELSRAETDRKSKKLHGQWRNLEHRLGVQVFEQDVWDTYLALSASQKLLCDNR
jgi:hypothetical protein